MGLTTFLSLSYTFRAWYSSWYIDEKRAPNVAALSSLLMSFVNLRT